MSGKEKTNGSLAMAPRVITIPATSQENIRKLRVAAYARVSSNSEDQKHSFAAQNAYYSKLITDDPDWELADIYADQGITGTSIDKRDDFLRMMEDCRKGRIDRILVKSSSRFARNAKESLEAVRELAALGVSVYFEEQNIDTAQVSGEVLIAMFAALAQRESEAISERMRWSYLDIDVFADAMLCDIRFKVPYIGELIRDTDCPAVEDYNDFAEALEDIWQQDGALLTYAAVLEAEKPETLHHACELLRNLDNYQRITEDAYGYGQQRLQETLGLDDEAIYELDGYMDFEKYGQDCMENDCVTKTEFGLLRRLEPPFPEQRQGQRMM